MIFKSPWKSVKPIEEKPIFRLIFETASRHPDRIAMIYVDGRKISYADTVRYIKAFASSLRSLGISKGDVVAINMPNCPEYIIAFHGILASGATVTTLNPLYREKELEYQLKDSQAKVMITTSALAPLVEKVKDKVGLQEVILADDENGMWRMIEKHLDKEWTPPELNVKQDLAVLPYSSGTTGFPKGVMLTHFNLTANVKQTIGTGEIRENDVILAFLPFFHIYGMTVLMNVSLAVGATIVIMPKFDLEQFLKMIQQYKVTKTYIVPPVALALISFKDLDKFDLSSLISITSAAAPLPLEVGEKLQATLPHAIVKQGYGMTEASPVVTLTPLDRSKVKIDSVGFPIPDTELKIVDVEDPSKTLPPGEPGELAIRGPQIMKGYLNKPEETSKVLTPDGWYLSGDIARIDEEGYVYILDRKKDMIKYKGYQIAPAELESVILSHPAVKDAAVIPKPDLEAGEIPKAFVVLKEGASLTEDELINFVAEQVAPYKKIREVEFVESIPKSATGKILKKVLIEKEKGGG